MIVLLLFLRLLALLLMEIKHYIALPLQVTFKSIQRHAHDVAVTYAATAREFADL